MVQWKGEGIQIKGRLQGLQSTDLGEAMSLLQGLRSTCPAQDCEMFIDNTGVVDTWDKDTLNNLEQGYTTQGEHYGTGYSCLREPYKGLGLEHGCSGCTHM